ncbi:hypothetical protein, partial [Geminicoccus harenae]|uniref:hypothetical protein n=1 Tax=Geminicoccus harenae TaxID=2498453 RepID=UPI001C974C0E
CQTWAKEPDRFRLDPSHHIPGPYKAGSDHEDRDIELIEARLGLVIEGECQVVAPHLLAAPAKKAGRGRSTAAAS